MKKYFILVAILVSSVHLFGQGLDSSSILTDTIYVKAFEQNKQQIAVASPITVISKNAIKRFDNQTLTPILNQYPGIRMEERSPGSYRLSIRGSSLRSPFGVRNVKVYWNEIPLSDGNGNTYFNFLDVNTIEQIEIIKGLGGSMYGAGIGGVVLLKSKEASYQQNKNNSIIGNMLVGSFGTLNTSLNIQNANEKVNSTLSFAKSKFGGYREHSKMDREVFNWRSSFFVNNKYTLSVNTMYADLAYQTPLGLTLTQKDENPRQARPATRFTPGTIEQNAGIKQKILLMGISQEFTPTQNFKTTISIFGNKTNLENPFITNYEVRDERTFGLRIISSFKHSLGKLSSSLNIGVESQATASEFDVYDNNSGEKGTNQSYEEVKANQGLAFIQYDLDLPSNLFLTAGLSTNSQKYSYSNRNIGFQNTIDNRFDIPLIPRISLLKKIKNSSIYATWSKGFSPPTVSELVTVYTRPSSNINTLAAETATNIEIGLKHESSDKKLYTEANIYHQKLENALVRAFDINEFTYFQNKGSIDQKGLELYASWLANKSFKLFASLNLVDYQFDEYVDLENDFSGNSIPSVANTTFTSGIDLRFLKNFFLNSNLSYLGDVPLDNANTVYADAYVLVDARLSWQKTFSGLETEIFVGSNNITNAAYGSGNDVNAFGSRYFNPSPTRSFNSGISLKFAF